MLCIALTIFIFVAIAVPFVIFVLPLFIDTNPIIEEKLFEVDKYPNKFYKVTENSKGDITMDPLTGTKTESTIIFLHDQYKNNKDIYLMFSEQLNVTANGKTSL